MAGEKTSAPIQESMMVQLRNYTEVQVESSLDALVEPKPVVANSSAPAANTTAPAKKHHTLPDQHLDLSKGSGVTKNFRGFTYQAFPISRNKIMIRLENLLDRFDITNSDTKFIDLTNFAKEFWVQS